MPRTARKQSGSGVYHVMLRGIDKQMIFKDEEDYEKLLQIIADGKVISGYKLLAYCLMGNHLHLLIKQEKEELGQIFRRIGSRYVLWYNSKYRRTGHLFQDRFKSEPVDDDSYFLTVLRYIHQNPVKAGLSKDVSEYPWSSYHDYIQGFGLADPEFGLSMFHEDKNEATTLFKKYMSEEEKTSCLDIEEIQKLTDEDAQEFIRKTFGIKSPEDLQTLTPDQRDNIIAALREKGLSIRQISRLTGVSFGIVRKM